MSAIDKEKIFVELRQYHTDVFPDKFSSPDLKDLHDDFVAVEDETVSMLLNLVNGKLAYVDLSQNLTDFKEKVKVVKTTDKTEIEDRTFFVSKIEQLEKILNMAQSATFHLKVPRHTKAVAVK